jgi:hypothetical protein
MGMGKRSHAMPRFRFRPAAGFAATLLLLLSPALHARPMVASVPEADCLAPIVQAEKDYNIPTGLLLAVALVESGGGGVPQPHILNVAGRVYFAKSETDALRHLRDPQGRVRGKVMAGCMQLSVTHHKASFTPLEKIVNPEANVRYAARLLVRLHSVTGSWGGAVAQYNGGNRKAAHVYQCKVQQRLTELGSDDRLADDKGCPRLAAMPITGKTRRAFEMAKADTVS